MLVRNTHLAPECVDAEEFVSYFDHQLHAGRIDPPRGFVANILIVDDNPPYADVIRRMLERDGHQVEVAMNGRTCLRRTKNGSLDVILLDLALPDLTGLQVLQCLRDEGCDVPVAILTGYIDEGVRIDAYRAGADLFLTKGVSNEELAVCVKSLVRRGKLAVEDRSRKPGSRTERFGDVLVDVATRSVTRGGAEMALSPKEYSLLLALLRRHGAMASRLELLEEVWGHRAAITTRTVDSHVAALRRKIEDQPSKPKYLLKVPKVGYRLRRDSEHAG